MSRSVIVVGAGMAGLTCADALRAAGYRPRVLEASARVGGRVGSIRHPSGHFIDRGFQVLFSAYPTVGRVLSLGSLALRPFDAGALVRRGDRWLAVANPLFHPGDWLTSLGAGLLAPADLPALARLGVEAAAEIGEPGESTADYLGRLGVSEGLLERFLRPFFGGVWLDRSLDVDASVFRFYWRMLTIGRAVLPAAGMQALPDQLAARLEPGTIDTGVRVAALRRDAGRVVGVVLDDGTQAVADHVVLATPVPELCRLLDEVPPLRGKAALTLYYAAPEAPFARRLIALGPDPASPVGIVAVPSLVASGYAPAGEHQVAVQVLPTDGRAPQLEPDAALAIVSGWFPDADVSAWRFLEAVSVPFGQYDQAPGAVHLPVRHAAGVVLASEATTQSSIEGAVLAGLRAAEAVQQADA